MWGFSHNHWITVSHDLGEDNQLMQSLVHLMSCIDFFFHVTRREQWVWVAMFLLIAVHSHLRPYFWTCYNWSAPFHEYIFIIHTWTQRLFESTSDGKWSEKAANCLFTKNRWEIVCGISTGVDTPLACGSDVNAVLRVFTWQNVVDAVLAVRQHKATADNEEVKKEKEKASTAGATQEVTPLKLRTSWRNVTLRIPSAALPILLILIPTRPDPLRGINKDDHRWLTPLRLSPLLESAPLH